MGDEKYRLRTNVREQFECVRRGITDVRGATDILRNLPDWRSVQRTFLGALEVSVDEWIEMTEVEQSYRGDEGGQKVRWPADCQIALFPLWYQVVPGVRRG